MKKTFISLDEVTRFLPDAVVVVDEDIQIIAANDHISTVFGFRPEEVIGQKLSMLLPHRYRAKHDQHFATYLKQPNVRRMGIGLHLFGLKKDATEIDVDIALAPVDVKGKRAVVATIRDVTDKKELERKLLKKNEQLEVINQELDKFGYMIAHDLKSPLINIHALIHLITKELPKEKSEKLEEYIAAVQNSVELMTNMISGVSAYTRASADKKNEEKIDLNLLVEDVRKLIRIPPQGQVAVKGQLPTIVGNRTKVIQVFVNLISNAFKHNSSEIPVVLIQCLEKGSTCMISISDNGPGVPVELRKRIFRLFDTGNSERNDSQGIGLSIVKKIVEERGGEIIVNDGALGGANFVFTWPNLMFTQEAKAPVSDNTLSRATCPFKAQRPL